MENDGNGKKNYPGKLAESNVFFIPVGQVIDLGNGFSEITATNQIQIPVVFDFTDFKPPYQNDDWCYIDTSKNIVHIMFEESSRSRFVMLMKKKEEKQSLTKEEENELSTSEILINTLPAAGVNKILKNYADTDILSLLATPQNVKDENTNPKEIKKKKEYRTKKDAGTCSDNLPTSLAIITNDQYKGGLGLSQTGGAYLYPLATTDGLSYDGKNLFFKGLPTSEATLKEINKDKDVAIDYIDLPLLRMFYSIILSDFEANSRKLGVVNETVTVYVPDLATLFGKGRNISKNDIKTIIDKTSSFQTIYGILKDPKKTNGIGTAVPLLVWLGYDEASNTIKFASPYMTELIKRIYNVSIRRDKKGIPKLKKNGEPLLEVSHSYLVKSNIVKERNKRAAEIVMVVVTTIEQAGNNIPHLKASTIIERVPQLQDAINKTKTQADKNRLLKRAFAKAWELLDTQTNLKEKYPTITLPDPKNPKNIPTMTTLDMVFKFPHSE